MLTDFEYKQIEDFNRSLIEKGYSVRYDTTYNGVFDVTFLRSTTLKISLIGSNNICISDSLRRDSIVVNYDAENIKIRIAFDSYVYLTCKNPSAIEGAKKLIDVLSKYMKVLSYNIDRLDIIRGLNTRFSVHMLTSTTDTIAFRSKSPAISSLIEDMFDSIPLIFLAHTDPKEIENVRKFLDYAALLDGEIIISLNLKDRVNINPLVAQCLGVRLFDFS